MLFAFNLFATFYLQHSGVWTLLLYGICNYLEFDLSFACHGAVLLDRICSTPLDQSSIYAGVQQLLCPKSVS